MWAAKVQASLRIRAVSPEPPLLAHTSNESRGTFRQKARSLAPLNGWTCAVKICHDGRLEDTNSLDVAQLIFGNNVTKMNWLTWILCVQVEQIFWTLSLKGSEKIFLTGDPLLLKFWGFIWTASSEFGTYRLCEQPRFRRAAKVQASLRIRAVSPEPSERKPDPWPLWMAGHAQLKFVMTECSKTQIRLTRPNWFLEIMWQKWTD